MARSVPRFPGTTRRPGPRTGASRSSTWRCRPARRSRKRVADMPMRLVLAALLVPLLLTGCATTPAEEDPVQQKLTELDGRIERTERSVSNQLAVSQHVDEMQTQLRDLQGRIDELEHANQTLAKQARDMYADLDKRLGGGGAGAAAAAAGAAEGAGSADAAPSSTEQAVYSQAFDALKAGSYSVAIAGFKDFMGTYPAS